MSIITVPSTITDEAELASWHLQTADDELTNNAGVAQVSTYSDRRWVCTYNILPQSVETMRQWEVFLHQLAQKANVVALGPPSYASGPNSGYGGSNPDVAGGSQLGSSLDVDGASGSTLILSEGDYISFDTTSAGGMSNRQLISVTADVTTAGGGTATIPLSYPIRDAPANNAEVELQTPTAFFTLVKPKGGVDRVIPPVLGTFQIALIERIWP